MGLLEKTGFTGIMIFVTCIILLVQIYYQIYLHVDDEEFGKWVLMTEAFLPSLALFITLWTTIYTLKNPHLLKNESSIMDSILQ